MSGEAAARARERLIAVGTIAALVTHEARNRLSVLRAALELLAEGLEANMSLEYRKALLEELDRFIGEFNLGVEMVRSDFGALAFIPLREVIEEAVGDYRPQLAGAGIAVELSLDQAPGPFRGDRRLVRLVLFNLLRNALQALRGRPDGRIAIQGRADGAVFRLEVEDNGPGVAPELRQRLLLEPPPGPGQAGIGLTLSRDAMVLMCGSIEYATAPGEPGARFRLTFPVGQAPTAGA